MIKLSEVARNKLVNVLAEESKPYIRFGLQGGGCSGFQYYFLVEEIKEEDDFIVPLDENFNMLVDAASMMYLENMDIDYKEELMQEGFVFNNPEASSTCGCGSSVSF